jgi:hypothetical protein
LFHIDKTFGRQNLAIPQGQFDKVVAELTENIMQEIREELAQMEDRIISKLKGTYTEPLNKQIPQILSQPSKPPVQEPQPMYLKLAPKCEKCGFVFTDSRLMCPKFLCWEARHCWIIPERREI